MSKNLTGARIKAEKEKIIKMYKDNIPIFDIAKEYGVVETTICRQLKIWDVPVKRRAYQRKKKRANNPKRKFSPELLAKMKENTRINNEHIKFFGTVRTRDDNFLVRSVLKKAEAIK